MSKWQSIQTISDDVQAGKQTATELVEKSLKIIEDKKEYKAIIATTAPRARERAKDIDKKVKSGEQVGRLAGVPFIAKDNFLAFGADTTAASNILKGFDAPYQATAIERLEAEGAICVAKANLDAFAHGSSTENSDFFTTLNPADKTRVPGGSSGGSAAAVMLDMAPFALGTDTGGSIRLPASFCGAVGYKPTYGLVSRSGVIAMASSTDVIGPITKNVADSALVLDVMAGKDELDSTTVERDPNPYTRLESEEKPTIGIIKEYMNEGLDSGVKKSLEDTIEKLKKAGYKFKTVSLPSTDLALACYYILCPAEISSNLARYDGQRFGYSDPKAKDLLESYENARSTGFGSEAKRRIMIGTYVLTSGYYDAYYKRAQIVRTKLIKEFEKAMEDVDFLISPTAPVTAFKIGEKASDDPLSMYLMDAMTVAVNLVGVPAISIPGPESNGLPVGIQFIAPKNKDRQLLSLSHDVESKI